MIFTKFILYTYANVLFVINITLYPSYFPQQCMWLLYMYPYIRMHVYYNATHLAAAVPGPTTAPATLTQPDVVCGECVFGHTYCYHHPC